MCDGNTSAPFYRSGEHSCVACGATDRWPLFLAIAASVALVLGACAHCLWHGWRAMRGSRPMEMSLLQGDEPEQQEPVEFCQTLTPRPLRRALLAVRRQRMLCYVAVKALSTPLKTMVSFFQVMVQLGRVLHFAFPQSVQRTFVDQFRVLALDVMSMLRPRCHGLGSAGGNKRVLRTCRERKILPEQGTS